MDATKARLLRLYVALARRFGHQDPPARTAGEVVMAAGGASRVKARRLRAFERWLRARFDGDRTGLRRAPLGPLRRDLLAAARLGGETTDAILLHAAGRPVFPADASVRRVLARHGLLAPGVGYEEARRGVEAHLPSDPVLFARLHASLRAVAASHCHAIARCEGCPLRFDLTGSPGAARRGAPPRRAARRRAPARPSP